jgi:hypothetical protein
MKITSGNKMTTGKLLDLVTTSSQAQNGVFSLNADSVEDGVVVRISSDQIKEASIIDIETNSKSVEKSSKLINLRAPNTTTGTMMDIVAPKLTTGTMVRLGAPQLTEGRIRVGLWLNIVLIAISNIGEDKSFADDFVCMGYCTPANRKNV